MLKRIWLSFSLLVGLVLQAEASLEAPTCSSLFVNRDAIDLHSDQLFHQILPPLRVTSKVYQAFDQSLEALELALPHIDDPQGAARWIRRNEEHLQAAKKLLTLHHVRFRETTFENEMALEILPEKSKSRPWAYNNFTHGLNKAGPVSVLYAPASLIRNGTIGIYRLMAHKFLTSAQSIRDGRVDFTAAHEARHRFYEAEAEAGRPSVFSTWFSWHKRGSIVDGIEFLGPNYSKIMPAEELVTHVQDLIVMTRIVTNRKSDPEIAYAYKQYLRSSTKQTIAIAENVTQSTDLARLILKSVARNFDFPVSIKLSANGAPALAIRLHRYFWSNSEALVIRKLNEQVIRVSIQRNKNEVEFQIPGSFEELLVEVQSLDGGRLPRERLQPLLHELRARTEVLAAAAQATRVGLDALYTRLNEAKSSGRKIPSRELLQLASAPRTALAPYLVKATGPQKSSHPLRPSTEQDTD